MHWEDLNIAYKTIASIDQSLCIKCGLCHIACEDTAHQAIAALRADGAARYEVIEAECVGCNLCRHVCPVEDCITMAAAAHRPTADDLEAPPEQPAARARRPPQ